LEKLRKRRDVVDEGGLHFESSPDATQCTVSARENSGSLAERMPPREAPATPRDGGGGLPRGGSRSFHDALNRQRTLVDNASEAWESKPAQKTADCTADRRNSRADVNTSGSGLRVSSGSGIRRADFREVIANQRAVVDGGGLHFESKPSGKGADFKSDMPRLAIPSLPSAGPSPKRKPESAPDTPSATPQETAGEQRQEAVVAAQAKEATAAAEEASEKAAPLPAGGSAEEAPHEAKVADAGVADADAAAAGVAGGDAPREEEDEEGQDELAPCLDAAAEAAASSDDDSGDDAVAAAEHSGEAAAAAAAGRRLTPEEVMKTKGNRVTWLVELGSPPLPTVFESPTFAIKKYGDVSMKLYPHGLDGASSRCTLVLSGPSPRPAGLQAMLFAGKGWKQKNLKPWADGEDMVEHFDIAWASRTMLLCGLVFSRT